MSTSALIQELTRTRDLLRRADRVWLTEKLCIKRSGEDFLLLYYPGSVAVFLAQNGAGGFTWSNGGGKLARRFTSVEDAYDFWNTHNQRLLTEAEGIGRG